MRRVSIVLCLLLIASTASSEQGIDLPGVLGGGDSAGFARALAPRTFAFPADHGPHPEYRSEWWYFTGNLSSAEGRRFGYEFTLFRFALSPLSPERSSQWASNQVFMAHLALTDAAARRFHAFERLARGALGLAGAQAAPFRLWLEDWSVAEDASGAWQLHAQQEHIALQLELHLAKPIVLQGEQGLSKKSAAPGNASYYYSIPRLTTRGTVTVDGQAHAVDGLSWMDREWSTSALAEDQAGWDWFALQLSDGYDLMFYQLRKKDGSIDRHSAGALIDAQGNAISLRADEVSIEVLDTWQSPRGAVYPARWRIGVKPVSLTLEVRPLLAEQELDLSVRYWEGAVEAEGEHRGKAVTGEGYVEMTGYGRK